ncbi:MAG: carbohydrate-binding domain-containing protein [Lachnospiraceae bacterium]|nr:carbohydrate-binding domain-containing protein [Lachnospiraceae bacterium]
MKKTISILLAIMMIASLAACGGAEKESTDSGSSASPTNHGTAAESSSASDSTAEAPDPVTDTDITAEEATGDFSLTTEDGKFTQNGNIYTVTAAGTYVLSGYLEGQIVVEAGEDDEITLELSGVAITYDKDSPVKILSAGSVDISAKKDTENVINDTRSPQTTEDETQGGAIYAKCDLKLKGSGTLVVNGGYNNGIHTTDDLKIQKLSLKVTAYDNALKGNDSVTVTSGTVVAISTNGDGVKTKNTDVSKNGVTRGDITVTGGSVAVYAAGDGFQAAHDFVMAAGEDGTVPTLVIYTGSYSGYTASDASTTSYKGIKVKNELNISAGELTVKSYDDGLHADEGTALDDGTKGLGNINISGGTITLNVYSPEGKTFGGQTGPGWGGRGGHGGWGGQQSVSGADGIHADAVLNISGGTVNIDSAYEGLEANVINISGGSAYVSANDDGVNATKGNTTPQVNVTGGFLDVTVAANGDVDGIDSNGTYTQSGGIVITRGPSSEMAAAIDADASVKLTGGTLIILGFGRVSTGSGVQSYSLSLHSAGTHTVTIDGTKYTFTNASAYGRTYVYSSVKVSA